MKGTEEKIKDEGWGGLFRLSNAILNCSLKPVFAPATTMEKEIFFKFSQLKCNACSFLKRGKVHLSVAHVLWSSLIVATRKLLLQACSPKVPTGTELIFNLSKLKFYKLQMEVKMAKP